MTRQRTSTRRARPAALAVLLAAALAGAAAAEEGPRGDVVFVHVDGTGLEDWHLARLYWAGPDGSLEWDRLPALGAYRGHVSDQLGATSNAAATAHGFGFKVQGPDSFGTDRGRPIEALSGFAGSILREALHRGVAVGVVNDDDVNGEPGTGAFLAAEDALSSARPFPDRDDSGLRSSGGDPTPPGPLAVAIAWASYADMCGGTPVRAAGLGAAWMTSPEPLREGEPPLSERFDNTDVYRLMYLALFGTRLPSGVGLAAPDRP